MNGKKYKRWGKKKAKRMLDKKQSLKRIAREEYLNKRCQEVVLMQEMDSQGGT